MAIVQPSLRWQRACSHLVCHIVKGEKTACNYFLLSDNGMEGGPCVVPASDTRAVRVNGTDVGGILLPLQVQMSPRDKGRPKPLHGEGGAVRRWRCSEGVEVQ